MRRHVGRLALELWLPAVVLAAWWALTDRSQSLYFPPAREVLESVGSTWLGERLVEDLVPSLLILAAGLGGAAILGIGLGTLLGSRPRLLRALTPTLEFLRAVPGVALIPVALLLLGIGTPTVIAVVTYAAAWPVLLNTIDGVRRVDPMARDVARVYDLPRRTALAAVTAPSALPQVLAGIRTAISIAVNALVFAEMIGSTGGLGYAVLQSQRTYAITEMWAGIVVLGLVGYGLNVGFRCLERWLLRAHPHAKNLSQETA